MPGTQPLFDETLKDYTYPIGAMDVCIRDDEVMDFLFDLRTLLSLRAALPENAFRRAEVENALFAVHQKLYYDPAACTEDQFRAGLGYYVYKPSESFSIGKEVINDQYFITGCEPLLTHDQSDFFFICIRIYLALI